MCTLQGFGVVAGQRNGRSLSFSANIHGGLGYNIAWWAVNWIYY